MEYLSLFSGACGGDLGCQHLLGWDCVGYVEWDYYCQKVIAARIQDGFLNDAPIFDDVQGLTKPMVDGAASLWYNSSRWMEDFDMPAKRKDYDEAVGLYNTGLSVGEVAAFYGVSRQSMYKVLKRRGVEFRPQLKFGKDNHFYRGGVSASDRAQNILEQAIIKGIVERKTHCEKCGHTGQMKDGRTAIQAHHSDYNKPLEADWLCQKCHHEWHATHKAIPKREEKPKEAGEVIDVITAGFP